jgi:hypothetical protein
MAENPTYNMPVEEEEGIDIIGLIKQLWDGRKTIIIWTAVFMVLGLVAAITMQRRYSVSSTLVPQMNSRSSSSLASLASLAGVDMGMTNTGSDLSPLVYPQIVQSVPFRLELLYTPLHYSKAGTAVSTYTYYTEYAKPTVIDVILKYTIGLPRVILGALQKKQPEISFPASEGNDENAPKVIVLSKAESELIKNIGSNVSLEVDKKEGYLTLSVSGIEPVQTAELAQKAQQLLQDEVTRFRTEKAQKQLEYVQARYDEIKAEAEKLQAQLATVRDRSQQMATTRSQIERERIQSKYNVANAIYGDMAKQLEQAKMQVKQDTPVLTVIQPITVPNKPANSRAKTLIIWTFLGFILGCGIVFIRQYLPKVKEMFAKKGEEADAQ